MAEFNVRSDSVNVEQIMEQLRARIREKRGVDYTEEQIRELAAVKLQKVLDPRGVRSNLLEEFRRSQPPYEPPALPNYAFEENTLFDSHRGVLRAIRRLLNPVLKLFFNPNTLIQALNIQARVNTMIAEREARHEASRRATESLYYELIHNLVIEITRLGIEVKNLSMRVESLSGRLDFNERRARALESVVVYKPSAEELPGASGPGGPDVAPKGELVGSAPEARPSWQREPQGQPGNRPPQVEGPGQRSRRRRRRRGRRGGRSAAALIGPPGAPSGPSGAPSGAPPQGETRSAPSETTPATTLSSGPSPGSSSPPSERESRSDGAQPNPRASDDSQ